MSAMKNKLVSITESTGKYTVDFLEEIGYAFALLSESIYWILFGQFKKQKVKLTNTVREMMSIGIGAIPIVAALMFAVGVMMAIQGIYTLKKFGAEPHIIPGIALAITREFAPLITCIIIAGRTGSALAAKIGTMKISQEIDALRVMGINPVRYLVSPALIAMCIMVPALTVMADVIGLFGGGVFIEMTIDVSLYAYFDRVMVILQSDDIIQGILKSFIFAIIITISGAVNGFSVKGGAEGVGKATTRAVVLSISYIILTDMIFTFILNR